MKLYIFYLLSFAALANANENELSDILKSGNNLFTARMFSEIVKRKPHESVVMSAYSVLTPLAQLALASGGESHDELLSAIGMPNDNVTKAVFSQEVDKIKSVPGIELKTANKIYVAKDLELNDDFSAVTRDIFNSEVENVDFTENQQAADDINSWVENQTNHKIKDLVDASSLDANTRALLVNAIYFKGLWKLPFKKEETIEKDFYVAKKKTIKVPMMHQKAEYNYTEDGGLKAQILEMFYDGDQASLIIVLPKKVQGIANLEKKLKDPNALDRALKNKSETVVEINIPKFNIETTTDLKDILNNMDVKQLFTPGSAQLNNLLKEEGKDLFIDGALQKAYIEVNEEGSEAGAANVFGGFGAGLQDKFFNANRPFYFQIRANGLPLFSGVKFE